MAVEATQSRSWGSMRSKPTEAMPKHSLFGTALENVDREALKDIEGRYIPEGLVKEIPNRYPLPPYIKEKIPGRDSLETSRKALAAQRTALTQADSQLKTKSEKVLAFKSDGARPGSNQGSILSNRPAWLSEKDIEHSKDINILGLAQHGSYNRDRYGKKPQVHNYSLIGDILAPKMDFNSPRSAGEVQKSGADGIKSNVIYGPGRQLPYDLMDKSQNSKKKIQPQSVIDLPPNIRHQFGSRVCDRLLSDQAIVTLALERQKSKMGPLRPSKKQNVKGLPVNLENTYESLGHTTRCNVCPGVSSGHKISRTKDEFNDEVHQRRVPNPDEYRYQRDELSIWVEQDVLRKRMEHGWKSYFDNIPKAVANWDRNAKRPAPPPAAKAPSKPKPLKPKSKQKPTDAPPDPDDDMNIVFVTPPLTPPLPPHPENDVIELPKKFERDDEFWSFYDQNPPP